MIYRYASKLFRLRMFRGCEAVTLPWAIYFATDEASTDKATVAHEVVHVMQRDAIGPFRFYFDYFCQYLRGLWLTWSHDGAYRQISYEVEAYRLQGVIAEGLPDSFNRPGS